MADASTQPSEALTEAKANDEKQQVKSLAKMAEAKILQDLTSSLDKHARSATFACGGSVSFKDAAVEAVGERLKEPTEQKPNTTNIPKANAAAVDDFQVRFGDSGSGVTVNFDQNGPSLHDFERLLKACQPASFGRAGEAVLDEKYRKAGKLDRSQFATNFCPYEAGIVDVVTQLLVPQHDHGRHERSIKAELYKLNVYSAPNGKFKPHVDTPRSKDQIGSLVVSLPSPHEGGQLTVNNAGVASQSVIFDWSTTDDAASAEIRWAAFYSDCEHEVHEVTSGHRMTLTYNLYLTRGAGHLAGASPALDATQLPLYEGLQTALKNPGFLRHGRVLAVYLSHSYAHTSEHANFLPDSLKGADMSLWNTAQALGLECHVVPIMAECRAHDEEEGPCYRGNYDESPYYLFKPNFQRLVRSRLVTEHDKTDSWGCKLPDHKVTWLNETGDASAGAEEFREAQTAYPTYGNEPGIGIGYTRAAMLIRIPPYHERGSSAAESEFFWEGIGSDITDDDDYVYEESTSNNSSDEVDYEYDEGDAVVEEALEDDEEQIESEIDLLALIASI